MTTIRTTPGPRHLTPDELLARLRWRYATKRFDPAARIDPRTWAVLEESLRLSPSSYGLQPWRFVVVTDAALRRELRAASWNQAQIVEASHLVVFAYRKGLAAADVRRHVERTAAERKVARESLAGFEKMMLGHVERPDIDEWSKRQVYLALGTFLTGAAVLGIDACPMEGIDPPRYDALLGLPAQGYATLCVATAGFRAADDPYASQAKVRFDAREVIQHV